MALIECPDCHKEISELAPTCPSCGRPNVKQVVTTQATGKLYKAVQLIGSVLIVAGFFSCIVSVSDTTQPSGENSRILLYLGVALYLIGRVGAWWHHG